MRKGLAGMSLTALRKHAKDDLGLVGLSKAPRDVVIAAIRGASQPKPMSNAQRCDNYSRQNGTPDRFTARQNRRIRKGIRKASASVA